MSSSALFIDGDAKMFLHVVFGGHFCYFELLETSSPFDFLDCTIHLVFVLREMRGVYHFVQLERNSVG